MLFWLERRGLTVTDAQVDRIFARAKASASVLAEEEILEELRRQLLASSSYRASFFSISGSAASSTSPTTSSDRALTFSSVSSRVCHASDPDRV